MEVAGILTTIMPRFKKKTVERILNFVLLLLVAVVWTYVFAAGRHSSQRQLELDQLEEDLEEETVV